MLRRGEIQKRLVNHLRAIADQIERVGVEEESVRVSVEGKGGPGYGQWFGLEREIRIEFVYALPPVFRDGDDISLTV